MPEGNHYGSQLDSRDIIAGFFPKLQTTMEDLWSARISIEVPSNREAEEYTWLGQVPVMREWVGGRHEEVLNLYTLTIRNHVYEATLPISVEDLRRDKTGMLRTRVAELAVRTGTHWNTLAANLIGAGEAGTVGLAYDGQFFYDTDHNESGTSQSNDLTATEVPSANVVDANAPTASEAANIIVETVSYMMSLTDDRGEPINQGPQAVVILVTKAAHLAAFNSATLLNVLTGSTDNPIRGLREKGWTFEVQYSPRITAANKVYFNIGNPELGGAPLIRQIETEVETQLEGAGSHEEMRNNRHVFGVKAVRGIGYGMWQRAALVTLS